jgi:hypothetical protein
MLESRRGDPEAVKRIAFHQAAVRYAENNILLSRGTIKTLSRIFSGLAHPNPGGEAVNPTE